MFTGKFKKGDKVRFVKDVSPYNNRMSYFGKILTIAGEYKGPYGLPHGYSVKESRTFFFREEELKLVAPAENELKFDGKNCVKDPKIKNRTAEIRFCVDPKDKKDAHRIAHEAVDSAIELYEKKKACEWTLTELHAARHLLGELLADLVKKFDGYYFHFQVNPVMKSVSLIIAESKFIPVICGGEALAFKAMKAYHAYPQNNDQFEENIGKLVCVCKALGKPIPVFIRDKNRRIEGEWRL
ncbi:MAG: hypothetical protein IIV40_04855 [Oscillospiraceae bacterium]|nr:hypothetical protein [Oscillospiraceae bacterium]